SDRRYRERGGRLGGELEPLLPLSWRARPMDPIETGSRAGPAESVKVDCVHADRCGGCPLIGLTYDEQLALKRGRVVQSVMRYSALELLYTEPVMPADPVVTYRTRAKLIVAPSSAPGETEASAKIGLFAKGGGHQVVDIPECRVLTPALS